MTSAVEHKAVLEAAGRAESEGATVHVLPVDSSGRVHPHVLADLLDSSPDGPTLVSVMWANSEVGTVQPIGELCRLAGERGAHFHTDAVQAVGKVPLPLADVPADLVTVTAHKLGGPVGIGLLVKRGSVAIEPLSYGGSQEKSLWPGTQNPLGAAGFAEAVRLAVTALPASAVRWRGMRQGLEQDLLATIPDLVVHAGDATDRLPNLLSVGIPGCDQAALLTALDLAGVAVSAGSACASGASTGSHVLEAMGVQPADAYAVIRFSFGPRTTEAEVEEAATRLREAVNRVRRPPS